MTLTSALPSLFSLADQPGDMKKAEFIKSQMAAASNFTAKSYAISQPLLGSIADSAKWKIEPQFIFLRQLWHDFKSPIKGQTILKANHGPLKSSTTQTKCPQDSISHLANN